MPASEAELVRMAAVHARAVEFGLDPRQADCAADMARWTPSTGGMRLCLECRQLRVGTTSRWWCSAQRQPLAQQFVVQPHRCPAFREVSDD